METREKVPTVIIDNGSHRLRAGYPGEEGPRVDIPSVVGQPRNKGVAMAAGLREFDVGFSAQENRGLLSTNQPVNGGHVQDWNDIEKLWSQVVYKELRITPENYCFVITQPANTGSEQKEKTLELLMETINAHSLYLGVSPVFALYGYGRTTGVVVDAGLDTTSAVPVHEGYALGRHVATSPVAGKMLTQHLCKLLEAKGYGFATHSEKELVNSVKETMCEVRVTPDEPAAPVEHFHLPDGQPIPMEEQRYDCPEALFNFGILGDEYIPKDKVFADDGHLFQPSLDKGISWLAYSAVNNCEATLRHTLYDNIVLAGGTSLFKGTQKRMLNEVNQFYKEMHPNEGMIPISISEAACRAYSAWLGACMLSNITMFPHLTVTRKEYEEHGARIIHCKSL